LKLINQLKHKKNLSRFLLRSVFSTIRQLIYLYNSIPVMTVAHIETSTTLDHHPHSGVTYSLGSRPLATT